MRPRRKVLIYAANPDVAANWNYVLDVHRFRCVPVSNLDDFSREIARFEDVEKKIPFYDGLLLCALSKEEAEGILESVSWPRRAVILVSGLGADPAAPPLRLGTHFLNFTGDSRTRVIENLIVSVARKRGPQRHPKANVPPSEHRNIHLSLA